MTQIASYDYHGNKHVFEDTDYIPHLSVYAVYIDEQKVLMVKDSKSGRWEFPGGGVEDGESDLVGLRREVYEETGLVIAEPVSEIKNITEYYYDLPTKEPWRSTRSFFRVANVSGEMLAMGNNDDTAEAKMVNRSEIKSLEISENIRKVLSVILFD